MGKTALITGGSRGIGLGIAKALAQKGYDLCINGVRPEADALQTLNALREQGTHIVYCQGNIALKADRQNLIAKCTNALGTVNVLVNNAGIAPPKRDDVLDIDEESYDVVMDTNLKGTFFLAQEMARKMVEEKKRNTHFQGTLINITSISAEVASINRAAYCMSKAALSMMSKVLAVRLAEYNIPVYEIRPGIIETDMTAGVKDKYNAQIQGGLTLEKRWGNPEDIGSIVSALAEGLIPYATGQVITPDGGLTLLRL